MTIPASHGHSCLLAENIMQGKIPKVESFLMEIDDFSKEWGAMKERQQSIEKAQSAHNAITNEKLDNIIDKLTIINGSVGKAHSRIDTLEPELKKAVDNGEDWASTKKMAKGVIALCVFAGGAGTLNILTWAVQAFGS